MDGEVNESSSFFHDLRKLHLNKKDEDNDDVSDNEQHSQGLFDILHTETISRLYELIKLEDNNGTLPMTPEMFCKVLRDVNMIEESESMKLYEKIDWTCMQRVSWDEFCASLQSDFTFKYRRRVDKKDVEFVKPILNGVPPHRESGVAVCHTVDGLWITVSVEGLTALWTNNADLKRYRLNLSTNRLKKKTPRNWITTATVMNEFNKIILTTGDREIQFYEMASFYPFCQLSGLETVPLCVSYRAVAYDKCLFTYGDQTGHVSIINFKCMWKSFRLWKKLPKHDDFIPSMPVNEAINEGQIIIHRWQAHKDWVLMVQYCVQTDFVLSCSKDPSASLVVGADHVIRLWNCFMTKKPVGNLHGHYDRIVALHLSPSSKRLFSISSDLWVKVWDVEDYRCMLTIHPFVHGVAGEFCSSSYCPRTDSLALFGDILAILKVKKIDREESQSHDHPVTCMQYNADFHHVISACEGSVIKLWDMTTGELMLDVLDTHGAHGISDMTLDGTRRRLVTVGRDGTGKIWNYTTGTCVRQLQPGVSGHGVHVLDVCRRAMLYQSPLNVSDFPLAFFRTSQPITGVVYVDMHCVKYILTAGWGRRLYTYQDVPLEMIPFEIAMSSKIWEDGVRGHHADILSIDYSGRDSVATGSFDGLAMVWSLESGKRLSVLKVPPPEGWSKEKLEADVGVCCVYFLKLRSRQRRGANLVLGGPYGHISFWSTNFNTTALEPVACFSCEEGLSSDDVVSVMVLDSDVDNEVLVAGDSDGRLTIWSIDSYALFSKESSPPIRLGAWQAHVGRVTGVKLTNGRSFVISASVDRTVRLWTRKGHYVGTFGQAALWELRNESTYKHPRRPRNVQAYLSAGGSSSHLAVDVVDTTGSEEVVTYQDAGEERPNPFDVGLGYFARQKANLSKVSRHLNDEQYTVMNPQGQAIPFQFLRYHPIQNPQEISVPKQTTLNEEFYDISNHDSS